jgi:hypothetical protein
VGNEGFLEVNSAVIGAEGNTQGLLAHGDRLGAGGK